jgi:DNA-nicking Smr family endonuclease
LTVFIRAAAVRRRGLTEADRALWQTYTARAAVRPLPGRAAPAAPSPVAVAQPPAGPAVTGAAAPPAAPAPPPSPRPPAELRVGAAPGGLDARRWRDLRRGRTRPERVLDLHGQRAQEAHGALRRFLAEAHADGVRCVAVVTGKGSTPEGGVLRRELPHWLNAPDLRPLLLGAAHPHAANPGAVHLLLRRRRG